jgi:hypothetical protein
LKLDPRSLDLGDLEQSLGRHDFVPVRGAFDPFGAPRLGDGQVAERRVEAADLGDLEQPFLDLGLLRSRPQKTDPILRSCVHALRGDDAGDGGELEDIPRVQKGPGVPKRSCGIAVHPLLSPPPDPRRLVPSRKKGEQR